MFTFEGPESVRSLPAKIPPVLSMSTVAPQKALDSDTSPCSSLGTTPRTSPVDSEKLADSPKDGVALERPLVAGRGARASGGHPDARDRSGACGTSCGTSRANATGLRVEAFSA